MSLILLLLAFCIALVGAAPENKFANCEVVVIDQMYVCPPHGHAFARGENGDWLDIGSLVPEPILVPTLPER